MAPHRLLRILGATAALLLALPAAAQWQWVDQDGRKVFSDRPPPTDIPDKNIIKRPAKRSVNVAPERAANEQASTPASAPASASSGPAGVDKELAARRKKAEDMEAEKRRLDKEKIERTRADNCARARQAKRDLEAGGRIARTNEKGERVILDDAARAADMQRANQIIASDCGAR